MSRVPSGDSAHLRDARLELGEVPDVLAALAHSPESYTGVWTLVRTSLLEGKIPRTTKELVALAATATAGIGPLRDLFQRSLEKRGVAPKVLDDLRERGETERLPTRVCALLLLGRRAAVTPQLLTDSDFAKARREGLTDAELAELMTLSGLLALLIATSRALDCL